MADLLYNGVAVPALPDYDGETYSYIALRKNEDGTTFNLYCCKSPPIINSAGRIVFANQTLGGCVAYSYTNGEWIGPTYSTALVGLSTTVDGVFWSNADILNPDGTVFLEASDPVSATWSGLQSWLIGYVLGLIEPMPISIRRELVGYSYNGVVLPELPEWDRATYPCAVIYELKFESSIVGKAHSYEVVFSKVPFLWISGDTLVSGITDSVCGYSMNLLNGETEWGELIEKSVEDYYKTSYLGTYPIWANHDIYVGDKEIDGLYYSTDELYLAASEPAPVYE